MKIFLDDFTVYSNMDNYSQKFILYFQKCIEYGISLNLDKSAFMVFSRMILGFIISKKGKLSYPKKIQAIVNMPPPKNPQHIQVCNEMAQFYKCFIKKNIAIMAPIIKLTRKTKTFGQKNVKRLGNQGREICRGLGLEINIKICNVWQSIGLISIFNEQSCKRRCLRFVKIEGMSMKGLMEIE